MGLQSIIQNHDGRWVAMFRGAHYRYTRACGGKEFEKRRTVARAGRSEKSAVRLGHGNIFDQSR